MTVIDGKSIANRRLEILRNKIQETKITPKLVVVTAGKDPATAIYVRQKMKAAERVGVEIEIVDRFEKVAADADGIIVQLPYPDQDGVIAKILPEKDVDNLTGRSRFVSPTVKAVISVVGDLTGKTVAVVGQGILVGKPLADYLERQKINVVRCDEFTKDLAKKTGQADVLVVATGVPSLIKADMVKPGAIVVDCGSPKAEVDFEEVKNIASAITPVPGGIGPLTVVSLLENTFEAAKMRNITHT